MGVDVLPVSARKKKRRRGPTPLEEAAGGEYAAAGEPRGDHSPLPPLFILDTLPPAMLRNRELIHAWAASRRVEQWFRLHCASLGIPLDSAWQSIELLTTYVEAELVSRVMWPAEYVIVTDGDDDEEDYPIRDADAPAHGLHIEPPPVPREKRFATLPGCQWHLIADVCHEQMQSAKEPCQTLRVYGQRFCPKHENAYLRMMRGLRHGG